MQNVPVSGGTDTTLHRYDGSSTSGGLKKLSSQALSVRNWVHDSEKQGDQECAIGAEWLEEMSEGGGVQRLPCQREAPGFEFVQSPLEGSRGQVQQIRHTWATLGGKCCTARGCPYFFATLHGPACNKRAIPGSGCAASDAVNRCTRYSVRAINASRTPVMGRRTVILPGATCAGLRAVRSMGRRTVAQAFRSRKAGARGQPRTGRRISF